MCIRDRNKCRFKNRRAHVDRYAPVLFETRSDQTAVRLHQNLALGGELLVMHKTHKTARPVAALFHFSTVSVEDEVAEIGHFVHGLFDDQNLVATHPEMPVGEQTQLLGTELDVLAHTVKHDEVVAGAMHLGEFEVHLFSSLCLKQSVVWSLTMPVACISAQQMVLPTNLKPRRFSSLLIACDSGVLAGVSAGLRHLFCFGLPSTKRQMKESKLPNSSWTSRNFCALMTAAATFRRLRTMPASCSNDSILFAP